MKYNLVDLDSLRDIPCRFVKVNHDLTTQLAIIITGLPTSKTAYKVQQYFKDGRP